MLRIGFVFSCKKWDIFLNAYVKGVNEKRTAFLYVNVHVDGIDVHHIDGCTCVGHTVL